MTGHLDAFTHLEWGHFVVVLASTLWQGGILAGLLWLILGLSPARYTTLRYFSACGVLLATVVLAMLTWSVVDRGVAPPGRMRFGAIYWGNIDWARLVGWLWAGGAGIMVCRAARGVIAAHRLADGGQPVRDAAILDVVSQVAARLGVRRRVSVLVHPFWQVPAVVGFIWPVLLLPAALISEISPEQLRQIVAHELAHVRRWDYLVNFAQRMVEAVLFFNPAVWWMSRQIRIEREACCDALAIGITGRPHEVARTLAELAQRLTAGWLAADGAMRLDGGGDGGVLERVKRILRPNARPAVSAPWFSALSAVAVSILVLVVLRVSADIAVVEAEKYVLSPETVREIAAIQAEAAPPAVRPMIPAASVELSGQLRTVDKSPVPSDNDAVDIVCRSGGGISSYPVQWGWFRKFNAKISQGQVTVLFEEPGYAPVAVGPLIPGKDGKLPFVDLVVGAGFDAVVHVVDADGKLVANPSYKAQFLPHAFVPVVLEGNGDEQGSFTIPHATTARPLTMEISAPGFEYCKLDLTLKQGEANVVQLARAKPAQGVVLDARTGLPIAGVRVRLFSRRGAVDDDFIPLTWYADLVPPVLCVTDAKGRFSIDGLRADCHNAVWVDADGYSSAFLPVAAGQQNLMWKLAPVHVIRGQITGHLSLLKSPTGYTLNAHYDQTEDVTFFPNGGYGMVKAIPVTVAEGVGRFEFDDPPSGHVSLAPPGLPPIEINTRAIPELIEIHLPDASSRSKPRKVILKVQVPAGAAEPTGLLVVSGLNYWAPMPSGVLPLIHGEATLQMQAPGKLTVSGTLAGYWMEAKKRIDIPEGTDPLTIVIPVVPAGVVHGRMVQPGGKAAPYTSIYAVEKTRSPLLDEGKFAVRPWDWGYRFDRGNFLISSVPLGEEVRLLAFQGASYVCSDEITVDGKNPIRDLTLSFAEGLPVHVIVLDADGVPKPAVRVGLFPQCEVVGVNVSDLWQTITDGQGEVGFEHVNPDLPWGYMLNVLPGDDQAGIKMPVKIDGKPVTITLPRGLALKGRVINGKTGEPIDQADVAAIPRGDDAARRFTVHIASDGDGSFFFKDLLPGQYSLEVRNAAPSDATVTTRPDGVDVRNPLGWPTLYTAGQKEEIQMRVQPLPLQLLPWAY